MVHRPPWQKMDIFHYAPPTTPSENKYSRPSPWKNNRKLIEEVKENLVDNLPRETTVKLQNPDSNIALSEVMFHCVFLK